MIKTWYIVQSYWLSQWVIDDPYIQGETYKESIAGKVLSSLSLSLSPGARPVKWQPFFILLIHGNILSRDKPL